MLLGNGLYMVSSNNGMLKRYMKSCGVISNY